ncbi:MAG TPA: hypothetical protein VK086_04405 [Ruania sp.]|nr:hypothetical protein [Ruania sp.]
MLRRRSWRSMLAGVVALLLLAGCAAPAYRDPGELTGPAPSTSGATAQLAQLLGELGSAFGTENADAAQIVGRDATVQVAVSKLRDALGFSDQVGATAAAWAQHWRSQARMRQVEITVEDAQLVGTWHGDPLAHVTVRVTTSELPGQEETDSFGYAMAWSDGALQWIGPLTRTGGELMVDTGVGLSSPTGAVQRYLDLVEHGDWKALERFSAGANTDRTDLEVLGSVIAAAEDLYLVPMPDRDDGEWTVYAVTGVSHVIGQFTVDLDATRVVYKPTV